MHDLPLRYRTPDAWAEQVLQSPLELLSDHAWLEKKAANNALDLINQWPRPALASRWMTEMAAVARDEVQHLGMVCRQLSRLGGRLQTRHACDYATQLNSLVRKRLGPRHLLDKLLVASLIEARSCERFTLLATAAPDAEMRRLYERLIGSEAGHHRRFVDLAAATHEDWETRQEELLTAEADIMRACPAGLLLGGAPV
ncbi:MAG: tRNA isopentenyl-2-thiomethyl-A-37 hydroxylase MiaE [Candidatus Xenobia bacterium]